MIGPEHVDYLQGATRAAAPERDAGDTAIPPASRASFHIVGIGKAKELAEKGEKALRFATSDLLTALCNNGMPVSFLLRGDTAGVQIEIGTWSDGENSLDQLASRMTVLGSALMASYPTIQWIEKQQCGISRAPQAAIALGIPVGKWNTEDSSEHPWDRLIRAVTATKWGVLVLARPELEENVLSLRSRALNEWRTVASAAQAEKTPSPLSEVYVDLLKSTVKNLSEGVNVGAWRTAVYLLGTSQSLPQLRGIWKGTFSGETSLPEPIRVYESQRAADWATNWRMPAIEGVPGPGIYRRPYEWETILSSTQLSSYIHLPRRETPGFAVMTSPDFDVIPPEVEESNPLKLGTIVHRTRETDGKYRVDFESLKRHAFVTGATGSGKTNTVFRLLRQIGKTKVKFLVIEPVKSEYRALGVSDDVNPGANVFTLGDEVISPFRVNPFEVVAWPTVPVGVHVDLLRSVFTSSFGMWTPLPQILEQCLLAIYKDRGWDLATNQNHRLVNEADRADVAASFPTLTDLAAKVEEVIKGLGYEQKISDDMRAALLTRINGLRVGAKGLMLDVQHSFPMKDLLENSTVLELQGMGDDDDKAFLMGILLIRLYEYRRAAGAFAELQHVLVIEEAHRLLSNVGSNKGPEEGNPRGKAVETFSNLLSEIRAYGQGVIVVDQVPVKLAPDVIKNTNLKIAHRVVAADDRAALAGSMAMNEQQSIALATLTKRYAAVFCEGDDAPVLVKVKKAKRDKSLPDDRVRERMAVVRDTHKAVFGSLLPDVDMSEAKAYLARDAAKALVDDAGFQRDFVRLVISVTELDGALDRLWSGVLARTNVVRRGEMDERVLLRCLITLASEWFANRRGAQWGWSYSEAAELRDRLRELLMAKLDEGDVDVNIPLEAFREVMYRLHSRESAPYQACGRICAESPPVCLYRFAVSDLIMRGRFTSAWHAALEKDEESKLKRPEESLRVGVDAAEQLIEFAGKDSTSNESEAADAAAKRVSLCFAQQMLNGDASSSQSSIDVITDKLLEEAARGRST